MSLFPVRHRVAAAAIAVTTSLMTLGAVVVPTSAQGATTAPSGPDVSRWQHPNGAPIDWTRVKLAGNRFAIVKASEGSSYTNPYFAGDRAAARRAGLAVGAYHFARPALPISTASDQATRFAAVLGNVRQSATLPPVLDLESTGGLTSAELVTWAQVFTETLRAATGRTPMVYTYSYFWSDLLAGSRAFTRYPLWLAAYRTTPPASIGGWPAYTLWQYSASAQVPGIVGNVDMSRFPGDAAAFNAFTDGTVATPWVVTAPQAPISVQATAGIRSAGVRWIPSDDGGKLPSSYSVTAYPGGLRVTRPGTATSASFAGLDQGVNYSFTVRATNAAGTSPSSAPSTAVLVRGEAPAMPSTPVATVGKGRVALTWKAPGATSYSVARCSPAPCTPTLVAARTSVPSYVDTAVTGGVTYAYAVTASNRWGSSGRSALTTAMPLPVVDRLAAPIGLTVTGAPSSLRVSWTAVPYAAKYHVFRCGGASCVPGGTPVAKLDIPTTRLTQTLTAGRTYTYAVRAVAGALTSPASRTASGTALIPQRLGIALSTATPVAGNATTVTVRLSRSDTGTPLAGRPVTVAFAPAAGAVPAPVVVQTSATGVASLVIRPRVSTVVTARSAGKDLVTASTGATVSVIPIVTAALSATVAKPGTTVTLTGRTSSLYAGERIYRQVRFVDGWKSVQSTVVSSTGTSRFAVIAGTTPSSMRVYAPASVRHLGRASAAVTLSSS